MPLLLPPPARGGGAGRSPHSTCDAGFYGVTTTNTVEKHEEYVDKLTRPGLTEEQQDALVKGAEDASKRADGLKKLRDNKMDMVPPLGGALGCAVVGASPCSYV